MSYICYGYLSPNVIFLAVPRGPGVVRDPQARPVSVHQTPSGRIHLTENGETLSYTIIVRA
jgi:hypothetical protein